LWEFKKKREREVTKKVTRTVYGPTSDQGGDKEAMQKTAGKKKKRESHGVSYTNRSKKKKECAEGRTIKLEKVQRKKLTLEEASDTTRRRGKCLDMMGDTRERALPGP